MHARRAAVPLLLSAAVLATASSISWLTFRERDATRDSARLTALASQMVNSLFDGRDALVDYSEHHAQDQLLRLNATDTSVEEALEESRPLAAGDAVLAKSLARQAQLVAAWRGVVEATVRRGSSTEAEHEKLDRLLSTLRDTNVGYVARIGERRSRALTVSAFANGAIVLGFSVFGLAGAFLLARRNRRSESAYAAAEGAVRAAQEELAEALQVASGEDETYSLLRRHIEWSLPESRVVVLNRDNSNDRLEPRTPAFAELGEPLLDASPQSCLAVRLGRPHAHAPERKRLLACGVCGALERATCLPSLVGGEVIGSVLVEHPSPLAPRTQQQLTDSVTQAAPVLANLRNLAVAETRAMTDALTGLANARALQDNLKRMVAHAGRNASVVSLLMLDLDRFKELNDVYGHDKGDLALAAVGDILSSAIRASDFAARHGGEEFVVVLPDTDKDDACEIAEKLRSMFEGIAIPGLERTVTGSFGVASYPQDAVEPQLLMRAADRALYLAKSNGRNTVAAAD